MWCSMSIPRVLSATAAVEGVELKDGRILAAETVVVAVGIKPNARIAAAAGLRVNRGIVVDDHLATSAPNVFAIGECAEHRGTCYGLVEPAYEQARVLAAHLAGDAAEYHGSAVATNLKVAGINVYSAGSFLGDVTTEQVTLHDAGLDVYRKLVIERGRLAGAVLFGDTIGRAVVSRSDPLRRLHRQIPRRPDLRPRARRTRSGVGTFP